MKRGKHMQELPIDPEFLRKRMMIPAKIAELSYRNEESALKYLRIWGEKRMPITDLFDELILALNQSK
jgi:hypothetical protein